VLDFGKFSFFFGVFFLRNRKFATEYSFFLGKSLPIYSKCHEQKNLIQLFEFLKKNFKCQYNVYKNIFKNMSKICHYFVAYKKKPFYLKECLTPFDHEWGLSKLKN